MVVKPAFTLAANGEDITQRIKDALISIKLDECDGYSDELSVAVSGVYERPIFGDTLTFALGLFTAGVDGGQFNYGDFRVHAVYIDYKAEVTEVRATAVEFSGAVKECKSRLWEGVTVADIAKHIAKDNGLNAAISGGDGVHISSRVQHNVSDAAFIQELAAEFGFICMIKDGSLILTPQKGGGGAVAVDKTECITLHIEHSAKSGYGAVELEWQDIDSATVQSVTAGGGSPVYYIRTVHPKTPQEAHSIAKAKLDKLNQDVIAGSLSFRGGRPICTGVTLELTIDGEATEYLIKAVSHKVTAEGYIVNVEFSGR